MFRQECEQFDKMGIHEKFIYILTYEGPLLSHVAKFVHRGIADVCFELHFRVTPGQFRSAAVG